jgi:hypothetical protein
MEISRTVKESKGLLPSGEEARAKSGRQFWEIRRIKANNSVTNLM